ncbi:hypothetical protein C349_03583 [Cryptococcus neoformans var. grubii Br795]|nr:hypothetical protein C353_03556 [Cryptococcus neoformans var. grubii AD1-83a]OWZ54465.1 hypothetical protein C368_03609 [Cryptococcus neoformans var. grubii 125.91]OXG41546.1 hypothetical protein C359_02952 [Cryptococcus neoformans var. grubii Bt120]OXG50117.1 hypothetical protein C355_03081 [Cryptococcus neoformans var. grubii Th84]OXG59026.1 hypothetical protein C354_03493 [Cryptococcus neoformans var. grubii MW-RSA1955]OXG63603.1 hypothetical protein C351_03281 [Cryptococcus neoformans v
MSSPHSPAGSPAEAHAASSTRPRNTVLDMQRRQLEKLLANPDKEVTLPTGPQEKTLRAPREMMKNVQGSSAGAGSGEFHVYKQSRRREYERIRLMTEKTRAEEEHAEFLKRQAERDAIAEAKTAKNRAKRQKRKQGRKGGADAAEGGATSTGDGGVAKRKLQGGAKVLFKKPGEEESESEEDAGPVAPAVEEEQKPEVAEPQRMAEEARISIVDED